MTSGEKFPDLPPAKNHLRDFVFFFGTSIDLHPHQSQPCPGVLTGCTGLWGALFIWAWHATTTS